MSRRRTTVHDLASLRVHPDGTRTPSSAPSISTPDAAPSGEHVVRSGHGIRPRLAKYTTQDIRGNLVARDAGGLGAVTRRFPASFARAREDQESFDIDRSHAEVRMDGIEQDNTVNEDGATQGTKRKGKEVTDLRAKKRMKFIDDMTFLEDRSSVSASLPPLSPSVAGYTIQADDTSFHLPAPSSDLLKAIHYFASEYYSSKGQLFDASRQVRHAIKKAKLRRLVEGSERDNREVPDNLDIVDADEALGPLDHLHWKDEGSEGPSDEENAQSMRSRTRGTSADPSSQKKISRRRKRLRRDPVQLRRDMYKAFDGSALLALGMLVQEHVYGALAPDVPEGWAEEMERYENNTDDEGDDERRARSQKTKKKKKKGDEQKDDQVAEKRKLGRPRKSLQNTGEAADDGIARTDEEEMNQVPQEDQQDDDRSSIGNLFDGNMPNPTLVIDDDSGDDDYVS